MDVDRFRKVCGMLGSDHAGERSAAALKATAMLKDAGMTWDQVGIGPTRGRHSERAEIIAWQANADLWKRLLDDERARTTHMANDMLRMKREIDRLKGVWPKGKPPRGRKKPEVDLDWRNSFEK